MVSDQFIWFLIIGAGLFALHAFLENPANRIRLGEADITMLASRWESQTGSAPTPDELSSLVEYHVREEILAREARRLGLDADDAILRRRLVQKMELLIRDRYEPPTPSENDLRAFFAEHKNDYAEPKRVGFRHVFLGAEADSSQVYLAQIRSSLKNSQSPNGWRSIGKPFMLARQYSPVSMQEASELFGQEFATGILGSEAPSDWKGPVHSSYGMHFVQILTVLPAETPDFEQVRNAVAADFRDAQLEAYEEGAWREIRERYHVMFPIPPG